MPGSLPPLLWVARWLCDTCACSWDLGLQTVTHFSGRQPAWQQPPILRGSPRSQGEGGGSLQGAVWVFKMCFK